MTLLTRYSSSTCTIVRNSFGWRLEASITLMASLDVVFDFFSRARNLQELTPPWLKFDVLTPEPIVMQPGTLIDYRIIIHGIPIRWRTEITRYEPPAIFTDRQLRGPYSLWDHTHTFEAISPEVTQARDIVVYRPRGGVLAPLLNSLFVQRDVERIFAFRHAMLAERFGIAGD